MEVKSEMVKLIDDTALEKMLAIVDTYHTENTQRNESMNEVRFDLNKIYELEDGLRGNINRMCVTHDIEELNKMRIWADNRIAEIFAMNYYRINEEAEKKPYSGS